MINLPDLTGVLNRKSAMANAVLMKRHKVPLDEIVAALESIYEDDSGVRFYAIDGQLCIFHDPRFRLPLGMRYAADYVEEVLAGPERKGRVVKNREGCDGILVDSREPTERRVPLRPTWYERLLAD